MKNLKPKASSAVSPAAAVNILVLDRSVTSSPAASCAACSCAFLNAAEMAYSSANVPYIPIPPPTRVPTPGSMAVPTNAAVLPAAHAGAKNPSELPNVCLNASQLSLPNSADLYLDSPAATNLSLFSLVGLAIYAVNSSWSPSVDAASPIDPQTPANSFWSSGIPVGLGAVTGACCVGRSNLETSYPEATNLCLICSFVVPSGMSVNSVPSGKVTLNIGIDYRNPGPDIFQDASFHENVGFLELDAAGVPLLALPGTLLRFSRICLYFALTSAI